MTQVNPPAVMPGTPAPKPNVESINSAWLDPIIDNLNAQALNVWQAAIAAFQAWLNDGQSGWFAQASAAVAAAQPLPTVPPLPTMTWSYGDGTGSYQQQTITPQATVTVPVVHAATNNPNTGQIAGGNPTTAGDTEQAQLQYCVSILAKIAAFLKIS